MPAGSRRGFPRLAAILALAAGLVAATAEAARAAEAPTATAAAPEPAAPRPRRRPRYKHLKPRPRQPRKRITDPSWRADVRAALEKLLVAKGRASKKYSADWPPVAVFVLDDVLVGHHPGEVAFLRMVESAEFRFSDAWWERIPLEFRERAKRAHGRFSQRPEPIRTEQERLGELPATVRAKEVEERLGGEPVRGKDEDFLTWRKAMFAAYDLQCRRDGRRVCRAWLAQLLMGYTEGEVESYMRETLVVALSDPFRVDKIQAHAGDERTVDAQRGLRRVPAMLELTEQLLAAGFDVWALSSSNQWIAEAVADRYGIDPSRVVGFTPRVVNKRLQAEISDIVPEPVGPGLTEAVIKKIGRDPDLVVATPEDLPLIEHGKGLRLVLDRADDVFRARAIDRGWLLQPELPVAGPEAPGEGGQ